ncbi:BZ3500_MvSof-1268-A1-R1_Chr8-2g10131 [Microbotryum saponariae]|uniref:BZ3500_MvSof-1268-A1-R1_Chr8-2g10131 protein n=1 Tax=Microbotryum saponariae TaxID=289078 RepID=A0A2X0MVV1_9BASI|nr:BZ3500_MvSof-1268-A1-R1_Chr8-2g10131 [Microbotryum saponariae]SDA01848.1 BZ3501_MvSof-1269-A2-R1_Chr8-2g09882 [Microbotryum saponariae]
MNAERAFNSSGSTIADGKATTVVAHKSTDAGVVAQHPSRDGHDQHAPLQTSSSTSSAPIETTDAATSSEKGIRFWLIIVSLMLATFLAALDVTAISTALPTIAEALDSREFAWIANAYSVTSCAFIPLAGGLSAIFGRREVLLVALAFFFVGSAMCGAAKSIDLMLAGRALQGVGAGSILTLTEIVLADLVPLSERGTYQGLFGAIWSLASATGPIIGGALAQAYWPALFYINLPLSFFIAIVVTLCMKLKKPPGTRQEKLARIDFLGNFIFIVSITLLIIGLVWGGAPYPWLSAHVLAPLIIGVVGLLVWGVYESRYATHPTVPFRVMNNRTTIIGFFTTFIHGISGLALFYYWPTYFQAIKGAGPIKSAVDFFSVAFVVAPFAMVAGASIGIFQHYKTQNIIAWVLMTVGPGVLSLATAGSPTKAWVPLPIPFSIGMGLLCESWPSELWSPRRENSPDLDLLSPVDAATVFPVLAPLSPALAGPALGFLVFIRSFGNLLGVTIGSVILTNELKQKALQEWLTSIPGGVSGAFASIPSIASLPEPLRSTVRLAFAHSIQRIWQVMIGFGGVGLIASLFMKSLALQTETDEVKISSLCSSAFFATNRELCATQNFGIREKKAQDEEHTPEEKEASH